MISKIVEMMVDAFLLVPGLRRITFSCLPASWYCSLTLLPLGCAPRQRVLLLLLFIVSSVVLLGIYQRRLWGPERRSGTRANK